MPKHRLEGHTVVYGGSYNPPHIGHQMACLYLLEALGAHQVWLMPSRQHPFGKDLVPLNHRKAMLDRLVVPFDQRVQVSTIEADEELSGKTYDTLCHLTERNPEQKFALAIGADIVAELDAWHRWPDIAEMVKVVILGRQGHEGHDPGMVPLPEVSSTEIRRRLAADESIEGLVCVSVAEYIDEHGLYRNQRA